MNSHYGTGPPQPLNSHQSRRHQEYHQYQQHHVAPLPPGPHGHNPYAHPFPPQYYAQQMNMQYQYTRRMPHQSYQTAYPQYQAQLPTYNGTRSPILMNTAPRMHHYPQLARNLPSSTSSTPSQSAYDSSVLEALAMSKSVDPPHESPSQSPTPRPPSRGSSMTAQHPSPAVPIFTPPLPWYSAAGGKDTFPARARRNKRRWNLQQVNENIQLPLRFVQEEFENGMAKAEKANDSADTVHFSTSQKSYHGGQSPQHEINDHHAQARDRKSSTDTASARKILTPDPPQPGINAPKLAVPVVPAIPQAALLPKSKRVTTLQMSVDDDKHDELDIVLPPNADQVMNGEGRTISEGQTIPIKVIPRSWADLVRAKSATKSAETMINGTAQSSASPSRTHTIAEVLSDFSVENGFKTAFIEPRGLVNTGNMCYMNSVLQLLVFCIPFYDFLDQVSKRATHSFKSDTPLIDAMIMLVREFRVIDSADSIEKLRLRLKDTELEEYGEPFIPEYVYGVINRLPRFSSMRRGHQQDAEEFLGFLLAALNDECVATIRAGGVPQSKLNTPSSPISITSQSADGWLEVGPKQKLAVTRQSGDQSASSPITRIFGGTLRSELRVPGLKNSITLEPYQPLQLDIGAPNISSITDALKGLTRPESLTGEFDSPRGPGTSATKQVFIESLPPVLLLHLKRFQYDSSGGTQKIWKRVGYPLELEMPKEVFPPAKRAGLALGGGLPKYRLVGVVYHHGKSAAGGHYTVDLLRQDRREWIRIDDTLIRRIRSEQVAEAGAGVDPKDPVKTLGQTQHEADQSLKRNPYEGLESGQEPENDETVAAWSIEPKKGWVGVAGNSVRATSGVTAAKTSASKRDGWKDNKVAYILLYERIVQ